MKKAIAILMAVALVSGSALQAQTTGRGAQAGTNTAGGDSFAWGIGLFGLAVIGTVVGVVAASASQHPTSFSH